ncbi:hypothetical protein BDZ45DRAFT_668372 [Acephala macrosclerotiorum]|nr:hypothetical protein BDZ45DRAFT_668372 [Acephala macrosclerotiorum]
MFKQYLNCSRSHPRLLIVPSKHFNQTQTISNSHRHHTRLNASNIKIRSSTIFTSLVALASIAATTPVARDTYYGVSVNVIASAGLDPSKVSEPAPVEINKLTQLNCGEGSGCSV